MPDALAGQVAIVTGASSGIGAATARSLARQQAKFALAARRNQRLEALAEEIREEHDTDVAVVATDVRDEEAVDELVARTIDRFGRLDLLVNNAGLAAGSSVEEMSTEEYRAMMAVNCDGMFHAARAGLPHLREAEGHLVFVASFAGKHPRSYNPVYAATKWWTRGFAKSLSAQVGQEVAVTIINPAAVRTEFEVEGESFRERFDPGEAVEPEEVADAITYAAKQSPSMIHEIDVYNRDKFADTFG